MIENRLPCPATSVARPRFQLAWLHVMGLSTAAMTVLTGFTLAMCYATAM